MSPFQWNRAMASDYFIQATSVIQCFWTRRAKSYQSIEISNMYTTVDPKTTKILKEVFSIIVKCLLNIINSLLSLGDIPEKLSCQKFSNTFTKTTSNLKFMSKIFKNVMSNYFFQRKKKCVKNLIVLIPPYEKRQLLELQMTCCCHLTTNASLFQCYLILVLLSTPQTTFCLRCAKLRCWFLTVNCC